MSTVLPHSVHGKAEPLLMTHDKWFKGKGFFCLQLLQNISSALSQRMTTYKINFQMVVFWVVTSCGYCSNISEYPAVSLFKVEMWRVMNLFFFLCGQVPGNIKTALDGIGRGQRHQWGPWGRVGEGGWEQRKGSSVHRWLFLSMQLILRSWWWTQYVPPKRWYPSTRQYTEPEQNNCLENLHSSKSFRRYFSSSRAM